MHDKSCSDSPEISGFTELLEEQQILNLILLHINC